MSFMSPLSGRHVLFKSIYFSYFLITRSDQHIAINLMNQCDALWNIKTIKVPLGYKETESQELTQP